MYDLESIIIPTLQELLSEQVTLQTTPPSEDITTRITTLQSAIDGWQAQIDRVNSLYGMADSGALESTSASIVSATGFDTSNIGLVAPDLLTSTDGSSVLVKNLDGTTASQANVKSVDMISAFSFTGGGSEFSFIESQSTQHEHKSGRSFKAVVDARVQLELQFEARINFLLLYSV